jgi:hypothetical protein
MGDILKMIWWAVIGLFRSRASLEAEILTLRHQLNVLRRKSPKRLLVDSTTRPTPDHVAGSDSPPDGRMDSPATYRGLRLGTRAEAYHPRLRLRRVFQTAASRLLYHTTDYIFESPSDLVSAQAIENYEIFVTIPHCSQFSALLI